MARILVTGGAGYIGSHTVHFLQKTGHSVIVVDNLLHGHADVAAKAPFKQIDLRETEKLTALLMEERIDAVIHFAALISVGESTEAPEEYFANNTGGSLSLFRAMLAAGVKHLVFSSTAAAYGIPTKTPITEDQPLAPINPYGESKVMTETMLNWLDRYRGLRSIRLRYFNVAGAEVNAGLGERHQPETHLIPLMLRAVKTGNPVKVFGNDYPTPDGTCIRDYVHVSDLAEAHVLAIESLLNGGTSDAFNVGSGNGYSVNEVIAAVEQAMQRKVPQVLAPRREGDPPSLVADSQKLQRTLGWKAQRSSIDRIVKDAWAFEQTL